MLSSVGRLDNFNCSYLVFQSHFQNSDPIAHNLKKNILVTKNPTIWSHLWSTQGSFVFLFAKLSLFDQSKYRASFFIWFSLQHLFIVHWIFLRFARGHDTDFPKLFFCLCYCIQKCMSMILALQNSDTKVSLFYSAIDNLMPLTILLWNSIL